MHGLIALIGGGEFSEGFESVHLSLLDKTGIPRSDQRVLFFPTAAALDGLGVVQEWAEKGVKHFESMGIQADAAMVVDTGTANSPKILEMIGKSTIVYLGSGLSQVLLTILRGSLVWKSILEGYDQRRLSIFGASAGAMILGEVVLVNASQHDYPPSAWTTGLGLLKSVGIAPHYDTFPDDWKRKAINSLPDNFTLLCIDEQTALSFVNNKLEIFGKGTVTVLKKLASLQARG